MQSLLEVVNNYIKFQCQILFLDIDHIIRYRYNNGVLRGVSVYKIDGSTKIVEYNIDFTEYGTILFLRQYTDDNNEYLQSYERR